MLRFVFLLLCLTCASASSATYSANDLENIALELVFNEYQLQFDPPETQKVTFEVAPLDKRLKQPYCVNGISRKIISNKIKSNTSVKINCADPTPWSTYVRVRVNTLLQVTVSKGALSKGQVLSSENIETTFMDQSRIRNGGYTSPEALYGVRLKRNINTGKVIKARDICFVCKGDKVTINANKGSLSISASGIALGDANIGGSVKVQNSRTQRIVVGSATGLKQVAVNF